jgi:hypothetical protein
MATPRQSSLFKNESVQTIEKRRRASTGHRTIEQPGGYFVAS